MQFIDKNIAILGLGEEGKDVFRWLKNNCRHCRVEIFDRVKTVNLDGFDIIFRSPGFYRYSPMLAAAEKRGAQITSAAKLFFELCPARIIGVTGTKGKGTTTTLIYEMLKEAGKTAYIAGNIGKPMLKLVPKLKAGDWVCLELSSFQLHDLTKSPHISVVLNITRDHLDIHRDLAEYRQAKANIVKFQTANDFAVLNADYGTTRALGKLTRAKIFWFSGKKLGLDLKKVKLRGGHNRENLAAAAAAAEIAGASRENAERVAYTFAGLEHRLEPVATVGGVRYFNDSFSTTPETAIAAVKSFSEPMTLILGGSDKGSDYTELGQILSRAVHVKNIILIGRMAAKIKASVKNFSGSIVNGGKDMPSIVATARRLTRPGGVVVLSPACASFDMFKNYKDRGEQFKQTVKNEK